MIQDGRVLWIALPKNLDQSDLRVEGLVPREALEAEAGTVGVVVIAHRRQLVEIAGKYQLDAAERFSVSANCLADIVQGVEHLERHHAHFIDHEDLCAFPEFERVLVLSDLCQNCLAGGGAESDAGPRMEGLRVAIQQDCGASGERAAVDFLA